jgi:phosphatidylglycerophosphatase A
VQRIVASTFGTGLILARLRGSDAGSGTIGAAMAIPLALAAHRAGLVAQVLALAVLVGAGLWAIRPFATGGSDPGWVVIDETAGATLAVLGLGGWPFVVGWGVARLADIFKILPGVGRAEALPGALGVMADDLVAGLYGLGAGWLVRALTG